MHLELVLYNHNSVGWKQLFWKINLWLAKHFHRGKSSFNKKRTELRIQLLLWEKGNKLLDEQLLKSGLKHWFKTKSWILLNKKKTLILNTRSFQVLSVWLNLNYSHSMRSCTMMQYYKEKLWIHSNFTRAILNKDEFLLRSTNWISTNSTWLDVFLP